MQKDATRWETLSSYKTQQRWINILTKPGVHEATRRRWGNAFRILQHARTFGIGAQETDAAMGKWMTLDQEVSVQQRKQSVE